MEHYDITCPHCRHPVLYLHGYFLACEQCHMLFYDNPDLYKKLNEMRKNPIRTDIP